MKVEKRTFQCNVLSEMLSVGMNEGEFRATEVKALMRYIFRIAIGLQGKEVDKDGNSKLFLLESELFGNAKTKASPIGIQVKHKGFKTSCCQIVKHKKVSKKELKEGIPSGTAFEIIIRKYRSSIFELEDYTTLFHLSMILGGVGKRSRRARGCIALNESFGINSKEELQVFIVDTLNWLNIKLNISNTNLYSLVEEGIYSSIKNQQSSTVRPIIQKIMIGNRISDIEQFLKNVDEASHQTKAYFYKKEEMYAEKGQEERNKQNHPNHFNTGYAQGRKRLASSLIVSLTELQDGSVYPIYTYVTPITKSGNYSDKKPDDRDAFIGYLHHPKEVKA